MKNYTFLTSNHEEREFEYLAINPEKIETHAVSETYDRNGQEVSHENAGDYHIDNQYSDAKQDCEKAVFEKFNKIVSIDAHNATIEVIENKEVDEWISENEDENAGNFISEINTFISEWCKENQNLLGCEGFNYWDGSNWRTVTTSYECGGNESHSILQDEELIEKLNNAIENKEFVKEGFGLTTYKFEDVTIVYSHFSSTFESYSLTIN